MLMPETPVDEDHCASRAEYEIWLSREIFPVKSIPVAKPVGKAAHDHLRLHILASNAAHILAALLRSEFICH